MERDRRIRGIDGTTLKIIALIIMTIDHLGAYCPRIAWVRPIVLELRCIGRIAAPIFLFCLAEGLQHTRDKGRYLRRIYIAAVCTGLGNAVIGGWLNYSFGNIFQTFAWVIGAVIVLERIGKSLGEKHYADAAGTLGLFAFVLVLSFLISGAANLPGFESAAPYIGAFICSPMEVEYSLGMVLLGVAWYFIGRPWQRCLLLAGLTILGGLGLFRLVGSGFGLFEGIQFFMLLCIPLLLLYNGKKGRGLKWLFYIYYPCHVWLFALLNRVYGV